MVAGPPFKAVKVRPLISKRTVIAGHNGSQCRTRIGLEHAFFNAAAPPPRRDRTGPGVGSQADSRAGCMRRRGTDSPFRGHRP